MERRRFVKLCAAAAVSPAMPPAPQGERLRIHSYARVKLVNEAREALRIGQLQVGTNYVFEYPFAATPCFLLRLERAAEGGVELRTEDGRSYPWGGGVGPDRSVVAYSAICAHKMTYPTRQVSFIAYRDGPSAVTGRAKVITCCSERSVYDPAMGARVVSGPAPQPLAAIVLEHDAKRDELYAVGAIGGEKFEEFFRKYDFRLQLEMGRRAHEVSAGSAIVHELAHYSLQSAKC